MAAAAPPPLDEAASGALVPYGMQQQQLQLMPGMGARMRHQALTQHRPLPNQLRNYCEALGGPSDRWVTNVDGAALGGHVMGVFLGAYPR